MWSFPCFLLAGGKICHFEGESEIFIQNFRDYGNSLFFCLIDGMRNMKKSVMWGGSFCVLLTVGLSDNMNRKPEREREASEGELPCVDHAVKAWERERKRQTEWETDRERKREKEKEREREKERSERELSSRDCYWYSISRYIVFMWKLHSKHAKEFLFKWLVQNIMLQSELR